MQRFTIFQIDTIRVRPLMRSRYPSRVLAMMTDNHGATLAALIAYLLSSLCSLWLFSAGAFNNVGPRPLEHSRMALFR